MPPPRYRQIAAALRERIDAMAPGTPLGSEESLAYDHDVNHNTIRRALDALAADGWIRRRTGHMAVVRRRPPVEEVRLGGGATVDYRPATDAERAELDIPAAVWVAEVRDGGRVRVVPVDRHRIVTD